MYKIIIKFLHKVNSNVSVLHAVLDFFGSNHQYYKTLTSYYYPELKIPTESYAFGKYVTNEEIYKICLEDEHYIEKYKEFSKSKEIAQFFFPSEQYPALSNKYKYLDTNIFVQAFGIKWKIASFYANDNDIIKLYIEEFPEELKSEKFNFRAILLSFTDQYETQVQVTESRTPVLLEYYKSESQNRNKCLWFSGYEYARTKTRFTLILELLEDTNTQKVEKSFYI